MSDKQATVPTAMKPPKEFRETIRIGSASSWDKNILSLFHVAFDPSKFSDLQLFLDPRYFQRPAEDEEFCQGNHIQGGVDTRLRQHFASIGRG